jgi:protein O-GlcNAc transferase
MLERLLDRLLRRAAVLMARSGSAHAPASGDRAAAERSLAAGNAAEQAGRIDEACGHYRAAVAAAPDWAKAHLNLGVGLEAAGDGEGALGAYRAAVAADPDDPYAAYNLGRLLHVRGERREAERLLRAVLARKPDFTDARIVLSSLYEGAGELAAAAGELELALRQRPDDSGALYNYGLILSRQGRDEEAQAEYGKAILHRPGFIEAHVALFDSCRKRGDFAAAATQLERVLEHRPEWADAWYDYGLMLKKVRKTAQAEAALRRAVALDPRHIPAQRMLGGVLLSQSRVAEALASYAEARERNPDSLEVESAELFALLFDDEVGDDELFARYKALGARIEAAHPPRFAAFGNEPDPHRRLRVGYVSGDFAFHPVALFLLPLLERRDRSAFEIHAYSVGDNVDDVTRRIRALVDGWHDASGMSAGALADAIYRDRVDILIDLSGHSGIPALASFAQRPAPVQATWLGVLSTTGMKRMQYRLCDRYTDPAGLTERFHTETLVRLPDSQWCYRPLVADETPGEPPFVRNGFVTFGSFNQAAKLSPSTRALWAAILGRVPGSRLTVLGTEGAAGAAFVADMSDRGVDPARITVVPHVPLRDYFRRYNEVDIALDPTPYSGGTTTCDTLWMGVPVITAPGSRPASRSAASILSTVGLGEWVAATPDDYVRLAAGLAARVPVSADARLALRDRMRRSPLMDEARFARDIESACRALWRAWCAEVR